MKSSDLFPLVVHRDYFHVPYPAQVQPTLDKRGIVEPIGNDIYSMLIDASDGMIRGIHREDLETLSLTADTGKSQAIENLRKSVFSATELHRQLSMTESGLGHVVLMGSWLTASCILLPELHNWASHHLKTKNILVSIPTREFMFLFSVGDASWRKHITEYIKRVVDGMDTHITFDLFFLDESGWIAYPWPDDGELDD